MTSEELIAGLVSEPGYVALCDFLQAQVDDLADSLSESQDPREAMRLLRVWQVSRKLVSTLKTAPMECKGDIDRMKERTSLEVVNSLRDDSEEDMFQRRSGPVAPPFVPPVV